MLPMRMLALVLSLFIASSWAWDLFLSGSQGYTHYEAEDFNRILYLMEKTTKEKGFNPYTVSQFDGHPQNALVLGARHKNFALGLEAEFWVETFIQSEVPFDLEEAERPDRISCEDLRNPSYTSTNLFGCVEAMETFNFLPITLQASYSHDIGKFFRLGGGYGIGVLAGSAQISMKADYFGEGAIANDKVRFQVWPGVNLVHKAFLDLEYLPLKWLGIDWRTGWRFSGIQSLTLQEKQGDSRIFSSVFPDAKNEAHLYIESFTNNPADDKLYVGTEAEAKQRALNNGTRFHLVNGDFTGWFIALKINLYWRDL
jgi:hypothetical protein